MSEPAVNPPRRRKRFQFSLRTLMIGVIAIGCAWLVTLKWGPGALMNYFARQNFHKAVDASLDQNAQAFQITARHDIEGAIPLAFRANVAAPAPFLLRLKWSEVTEHGWDSDSDFKASVQDEYYVWFAGHVWPVGNYAHPTFQIRNWIY